METLFTTIIMSYMIIFIIIISAEFLEAMPNNSERSTLAYTSSHDFLFISGWPQSGTSLMQQIFAVSPRTSTMIDKCTEQIPGRHCLDWNYEGQWLLRYQPEPARLVNSNASNLINAGSMCEAVYPTQESQEVSIISYADQKLMLEREYKRGGDLTQSPYWTNHWDGIYNISSTWGKFWNLEKPLLVEKSPQSMLKSNLLREIFSDARSIKFVIMLKHPATLNVALPKGFEWVTGAVKKTVNETDADGIVTLTKKMFEYLLSPAEVENNARFFIHFMQHRMMGVGRKCTIGWLAAMDELYSDLQWGRQALRVADTKIVRYEDFSKPFKTCRSLYQFVHARDENSFREAENKVCRKYFILPNITSKANFRKTRRGSGNIPRVAKRRMSLEGQMKQSVAHGAGRQSRQLSGHTSEESPVSHDNATYDPLHDNIDYSSDSMDFNWGKIDMNSADFDITEGDRSRRNLRLRWPNQPPPTGNEKLRIDFDPEIHKNSIVERLAQYQMAYKMLPLAMQLELDAINERLKKFGYSLESGKESWYLSNPSVLDEWVNQL